MPLKTERVDKNILICGFRYLFFFICLILFFPSPCLSDTWRAINRLFREGEAQGGSAVRQSLAFSASHAPCRHILTVPRLFVELWSPNVLRQHLCFHFQFHRFQRPIWRLSEAIVSPRMQNLSALCTATSGFCARRYLPLRKRLRSSCFYLKRRIIFHQDDRNTGGGASGWDGELRSEGRAVMLFGRAARDKRGKEPPQSLCIPLTNFDFAGCTNNQVRKWLRLLFQFHVCWTRSLKEATASRAQHLADNNKKKGALACWCLTMC